MKKWNNAELVELNIAETAKVNSDDWTTIANGHKGWCNLHKEATFELGCNCGYENIAGGGNGGEEGLS